MAAEAIGRFDPTPESEVYALEFWPLEQAKRGRRRSLEGRVALVTGAAGAIGAGIAAALARLGATVFLADRPGAEDERRLARAVARVRREAGEDQALALPFDVSVPGDVDRALGRAALACGGVDLLVLSHGMAEVAGIDSIDPRRLETVFKVNALGAFHVLGAYVRQVRVQGAGGDVVLVSTKNVPDPGASFSAYSASKAAAHQLARVAAIELAPDDIRVNLVSPDAVFGDREIPSKLWQEVGPGRARSKGLDPAQLPEHYRRRNLLETPVRVEDVARAVLFFARRQTPTTGAVIPVDGGLPGAFPR
ncbi:MAG: SDR family oxidoreductase [Acidobacteriota bacterium]|nr:SDR family oxidoreductase [Acidobacteriota bacterium]